MQAKLITGSGKIHLLSQDKTTIGRHKSNDLQVADERASRRHCKILRDDLVFKVRDLGGGNGTYVNDARLERKGERVLRAGDQLRIGKTVLMFTIEYASDQEKRDSEISAFQSASDDALKSAIVLNVDREASDEVRSEMSKSGCFAESDTQVDSAIAADMPLSPERFMVATSSVMKNVFDLLNRAAQTDFTVLIRGETGTGKELAARAIHCCSSRREKTMAKISMPGIPETLLESQLFGHLKGAFTGAVDTTKGWLELANGGTILLDEIGELTPNCQAKLLRVLEERTFVPVGGRKEISFDTRVVAATNRDLEQAVKDGLFADALYFRLKVLQITLPPLRERKEDIPLLAQHFFEQAKQKTRRDVSGISDHALEALQAYNWPGNVRELKGCIESAVALGENPLLMPEDFPIFDERLEVDIEDNEEFPTLEGVEKKYILLALKRTHWNITQSAELLGIGRSTLHSKMDRHGIRGDKL